jgi:hypothetical protein
MKRPVFVSQLWPRDVDILIDVVPDFYVVFRELLSGLQNLLVQLSLSKRKFSNHEFKISIFSLFHLYQPQSLTSHGVRQSTMTV